MKNQGVFQSFWNGHAFVYIWFVKRILRGRVQNTFTCLHGAVVVLTGRPPNACERFFGKLDSGNRSGCSQEHFCEQSFEATPWRYLMEKYSRTWTFLLSFGFCTFFPLTRFSFYFYPCFFLPESLFILISFLPTIPSLPCFSTLIFFTILLYVRPDDLCC